MKAFATIPLVLCLFALGALAQEETPRIEVTAGYQLFHRDSASGGHTNVNGWSADGTVYLKSWVGLTANFGGIYDSGSLPLFGPWNGHEYQFLFGPTFKYRATRHLEPYAHALFGVEHVTANFNFIIPVPFFKSEAGNEFAMALGGGLDVPVARHIAIRLGNADYYQVRSSHPFHNFRFSTGVQFRF